MKKIILFIIFFSYNAFAQKQILCSDGACNPNFIPREHFEKIYHSGVDAGVDNEDDVEAITGSTQAPRSLRLFIDNKEGHSPNAIINLTSNSEFYNSGDAMLIGNLFNNITMILNGYSGMTGKPASQVCAERYQMGGSNGYGDVARAEFQAKRIDNPSIPLNKCVYSDVEYLQNNAFTCDEENFAPIDPISPAVTVRRFRGKNKCLGVSFNDVCLQRSVEVTCTWNLEYMEEPGALTQDYIFNNWARFQGNTYFPNKASATGEANSFYLSGGKIYNSSNSENSIGFLSNQNFDYYTLTGVMQSLDLDDDTIGFIVASKIVGSRLHTLSVIRNTSNASWSLVYNYGLSGTLNYSNKSIGSKHVYTGGSSAGWNGKTSPFKIERKGDLIRAWTGDWNTGTYRSDSLLEIKLNEHSGLSMFRNTGLIGFFSQSQSRSSVTIDTFSGKGIGGYSPHAEETIRKSFVMSELEYETKKNLGQTKYLCDNLARSNSTTSSEELIGNGGFNKNVNFWTLGGNSYWQNAKLKLYSGPLVNDPAENIPGVKRIDNVGNPQQQSFKGYPTNIYINFKLKSPVVNPDPNNLTLTFLYQKPGFVCDLRREECYFQQHPDNIYHQGMLLATIKIEDKEGFKSFYDIKANVQYAYDQTTAFVGGYSKKMRCSGSTRSNSSYYKYTLNERNNHCAGGSCFGNNPLASVRVYNPDASSILNWHKISGDWRRKCGGDYIFSVGYHFFKKHYPSISYERRIDLEDAAIATARQVIQTQNGRKYRLTALLKSAMEELRAVKLKVNVYSGSNPLDENKIASFIAREEGLSYNTGIQRNTPVDVTFIARSSNTLIELIQDDLNYSAYIDDVSIKRIEIDAGPPVAAEEPPVPNVMSLDGFPSQYKLLTDPTVRRTAPSYDVEQLLNLPESSWKISYTPIGAECPAFSDKIRKNYLVSAISYDENDNLCDDVSTPEDTQGLLSWRNIGFERKSEFGLESIACAPTNCPVSFTIEDKARILDTIDTSSGISGTQQGQGIIFIYDSNSVQTNASIGIPGYAGTNDLPEISEAKMCARVNDAINNPENSPFSSEPSVEFRRYNWKAFEVKGSDIQPKIPENNGKRVHVFKKLDSSLRHLLKQELL